MKLTKFEHACLVLSSGAENVVVDPGGFTLPLTDLDGVVAIVITHEHADHWTAEHLDRLLARNPDAAIFAPAAEYRIDVVSSGDKRTAGSFRFEFFGEKHAVIHSSIPIVDNVGVLINETIYYAGDSFTVPGVEIDTLAVPIGAPWLKVSEAMDYVTAVKPRKSFPTHEMVLSVIGKNMVNARIEAVTAAGGGEFFPLEPGESLDL
jgi:L-ascorbate metabolism protein UlaG (beta-lactamase superfamily)